MKNTLALLLLLSMPLGVVAMAQDRNADEENVRLLDDQERIAALKRDISTLERLWSEQLTVNAPNNQIVVGRRAVLDVFVRAGVINFSKFERQIEFIRADGPFVIIMGLETVEPVSDAPSRRGSCVKSIDVLLDQLPPKRLEGRFRYLRAGVRGM